MSPLLRPPLGVLDEAVSHARQLQGHLDRGEALTPTEQRLVACAGEVQGLLRLLRVLTEEDSSRAGITRQRIAEAVRLVEADPQKFIDANDAVGFTVATLTDAEAEIERLRRVEMEVESWKDALREWPLERDALRKQKDDAYTERNAVVAALSKLYPSYLALHPDDSEWDAERRAIVFVETPAGQLSWHLHDSHLQMFRHLPWKENRWDGHTTEQKYQRLAAL